jgi:hypothetical protein
MTQENALPLGDTPADDARSIVTELKATMSEYDSSEDACWIRTVLTSELAERL